MQVTAAHDASLTRAYLDAQQNTLHLKLQLASVKVEAASSSQL